MRLIAHPFLLALLVASGPVHAADTSIHITRSGDVFHVEARAEFEGNIARTWKVLTDYGRSSEYIPDVTESRIVSRAGNRVEVEQKGEARVMFLSYPIDVRLSITEQPYERVISRAISGSFREMRNVYSLEEGEGRVLLRYAGRLVPDFNVPPVVGTLVLKHHIEAMFRALVGEIERHNRGPADTAEKK